MSWSWAAETSTWRTQQVMSKVAKMTKWHLSMLGARQGGAERPVKTNRVKFNDQRPKDRLSGTACLSAFIHYTTKEETAVDLGLKLFLQTSVPFEGHGLRFGLTAPVNTRLKQQHRFVHLRSAHSCTFRIYPTWRTKSIQLSVVQSECCPQLSGDVISFI